MQLYKIIEYSDNYSKISGSLWQYFRVQPVIDNEENIADFLDDPNSASFKQYKGKITGQTENNQRRQLQVMVPVQLKYLSNFWRTFEMALINCKINVFLTWPEKCFIVTGDNKPKMGTTDRKLYVSIVILSTHGKEKYCNN